MIIKNLSHQINYRKVLSIWESLKVKEGKDISPKERACLYLCSLSNVFTIYLCENYDFDFLYDKDYYNDETSLLIRMVKYIFEGSKCDVLLDEVVSDELGPYILQAIQIAFPVLRTGHSNKRNAGRKSIYSDELIKSIVLDRENGLTYNELSEKYNIPKSTIQFHCKNAKAVK